MAVLKMSKTALKSLFTKPATKMYPVVPKEYKERTRGAIDIDIESCIFCGICSRKCPSNAIKVTKAEKTWEIERMRCVQCNCCVEVCPKKCLSMNNKYTEPNTEKVKDTFKDARVPDNTTDNQNS